MFVENYRLDAMIGGQAQTTIPYPKISDDDWQKWKAFLPVKSAPFCKKVLLDRRKSVLQAVYGIPFDVYHEMVRGAGHFQEIEVWGKREVYKDPIAVGITGNGERHLICRWGMDRLIPFERIKSRSWLYHIQNLGVALVTSESFWLRFAVAVLLGIGYIGAFLNA
ncbi:MAG TPA: hypothetical protein VK747_22945 [Blastocatellia bacterium]|nr:hypothetical protein [Blastocatellia bacterium]